MAQLGLATIRDLRNALFDALFRDNLAANGGFELEELGSVAMWSTSAWVQSDEAVRFFVTSDTKHGGSRSFAIANLQPNDSRAMQWISVKPGTNYRLSCWIYAQGIETPSIGANISVLGATLAAGDLRDTGGKWQLVELYGKTGPQQQAIAVLARLGFHGSLATGLALFDDFTVEEDSRPQEVETFEPVVVKARPSPTEVEAPRLSVARVRAPGEGRFLFVLFDGAHVTPPATERARATAAKKTCTKPPLAVLPRDALK